MLEGKGFPPSKIIFWTEIKQGSCASQLQGRHDGNQCVILFIGEAQLLQHQFRQVQLGTERKIETLPHIKRIQRRILKLKS